MPTNERVFVVLALVAGATEVFAIYSGRMKSRVFFGAVAGVLVFAAMMVATTYPNYERYRTIHIFGIEYRLVIVLGVACGVLLFVAPIILGAYRDASSRRRR